MKTIKITLARNKENELYKRKHYWLVLNAPIVADFNAPDDTMLQNMRFQWLKTDEYILMKTPD